MGHQEMEMKITDLQQINFQLNRDHLVPHKQIQKFLHTGMPIAFTSATVAFAAPPGGEDTNAFDAQGGWQPDP